jgi:PPK2 family polyphosphate:nucleotide phosphotransferase
MDDRWNNTMNHHDVEHFDPDRYRVAQGQADPLALAAPDDDAGLDKDEGEREFAQLTQRLSDLQELMYAQGKHALLVVLQAMDAGGKDSTIRHVFGPINPQGCKVVSFKAPTPLELTHDFLWRVHQAVPPKGILGVFNRSHYEDVLVVRVKNLTPPSVWAKRYDHIRDLERLLHDEGTHLVKFYLHISKAYQKDRLQRRLDDPRKHWKFNPDDLKERARWDDYQQAFRDALSKTSTAQAPWYVVPAEKRWFRNLLIAKVLVRTLEALDMQYPKPTFDPAAIRIDD